MPPYIPAHGVELIDKIASPAPRGAGTITITIIYRGKWLAKGESQGETQWTLLHSCGTSFGTSFGTQGVSSCGSFDPGTSGLAHVRLAHVPKDPSELPVLGHASHLGA
jgi:hypothetical protein